MDEKQQQQKHLNFCLALNCIDYKLNFNELKNECGEVLFTHYYCDSEMISPTMMMETEVDSDTDTVKEYEEGNNIYEEILNQDNYRARHNQSQLSLSTTSSIYRASWWGWPGPQETNNSTFQVEHFFKNHNLLPVKINYFQLVLFEPLASPCYGRLRDYFWQQQCLLWGLIKISNKENNDLH